MKTYHEVGERGETRIHNFNDFPEEEKAARLVINTILIYLLKQCFQQTERICWSNSSNRQRGMLTDEKEGRMNVDQWQRWWREERWPMREQGQKWMLANEKSGEGTLTNEIAGVERNFCQWEMGRDDCWAMRAEFFDQGDLLAWGRVSGVKRISWKTWRYLIKSAPSYRPMRAQIREQ